MSFLEDLATRLNNSGIGVYPGTASTRTIYISELPDSPDALICLYARPGRTKNIGCDHQYPDLHVEVRAATYTAAQTKAEAINAALHAQYDQIWSGRTFYTIVALGSPSKLKTDTRGRTIFYQNFTIDCDP